MTEKSEAPHGRAPGEAPKLDKTRQKNPTKFTAEGQGSTADRLQRIAEALDRYILSQKGGRR